MLYEVCLQDKGILNDNYVFFMYDEMADKAHKAEVGACTRKWYGLLVFRKFRHTADATLNVKILYGNRKEMT